MKIHEYQAKKLFSDFGIPVPAGCLIYTPEQIRKCTASMRWPLVMKAQIHAGGRGKAGGIKLVETEDHARRVAASVLGSKLATLQSGGSGRIVNQIWIEECEDIAAEYYVAIVLDRQLSKATMIASAAGGMEIEEVHRKNPEKIFREVIDPIIGLRTFQARKLAFRLGLQESMPSMVNLLAALEKLFRLYDCTLVEINPLALLKNGSIVALDAKINFDDSALYRHPNIISMRDVREEEALEVEASTAGLNYIKLDGNIGCMVNGAGLAMATMDIIKIHGGIPANFLDVGGGADENQVEKAFKILISDPNVKAVLVNIFGGIVRCDLVAKGIISAAQSINFNLPVVVRLLGTNREVGIASLKESNLSFQIADDMEEASRLVTQAAVES